MLISSVAKNIEPRLKNMFDNSGTNSLQEGEHVRQCKESTRWKAMLDSNIRVYKMEGNIRQ